MPGAETDSAGCENGLVKYTEGFKYVFVSLNRCVCVYMCVSSTPHTLTPRLDRYERKKNVMLALQALCLLLAPAEGGGGGVKTMDVLLVVAGGYDERVTENVEYFQVGGCMTGWGQLICHRRSWWNTLVSMG